jgi:two-component system, chemotaxis family, protein-glutamate methylesterase/glutaminase
MPGHDIIVVGFSAGGVEALTRLVSDLPSDLPASLFVVHHFPAEIVSALPSILRRVGELPVVHPKHGQSIERGQIYVAPSDRHMLIDGEHIHLSRGPRENGHRPAIDPLFRSAARAFGPRVVAVLLSGALDDGVAGLAAVKRRGGVTVAQDPNDAHYPSMPRSAIERVPVDHVLPSAELAQLLARLAAEPAATKGGHHAMIPEDLKPQDPAEAGTADIETGPLPGPPTPLTCPDCGGTLWELVSGDLVRYRCHVGHAYSSDSLVSAQAHTLESALWSALRALEEKAELSRRMAERIGKRGIERLALRYRQAVRDAERGSDVLRELLLAGSAAAPQPIESDIQEEDLPDLATTEQR